MHDHESHVTTDREVIRKWIEDRGGIPSTVRATEEASGKPGVLRVDFPGYGAGEDVLEHIGWDEFFRKFEAAHLSFLYQNQTKSGGNSRFFKFVSREEHPA